MTWGLFGVLGFDALRYKHAPFGFSRSLHIFIDPDLLHDPVHHLWDVGAEAPTF